MDASGNRLAAVVVREALLLALLAVGAWVFLNHGLLYFTGDTAPRSTRAEAYVVTTLVFYVFVRGTFLVLSLRPPRAEGDLVPCPECGQELDDGTPKGLIEHYRTALTPRPTERDVLAAIALRRAVDKARLGADRTRRGTDPLDALLDRIVDNPPRGGTVRHPVAPTPRDPPHPDGREDL